MAAVVREHAKPKDMRRTLKFLSHYFKKHAAILALVTVLIIIGAGANVLGTYLVKPIVNDYIVPGDIRGLVRILTILGGIYLSGVAATYGYSQIMLAVRKTVSMPSAFNRRTLCSRSTVFRASREMSLTTTS